MLEGISVATLTPPAVLMLVVVLILLGRIVPRQTLLDKTKEAEKWQKAYEAEREARALSNSQTVELLEVTRTTYHLEHCQILRRLNCSRLLGLRITFSR